jgi:hypothetical protein
MALTDDLNAKLTRWHTVKAQLAALTEEETNLRKDIFASAFPNQPDSGTHRLSLGFGKDLKVSPKLNYSIDRAAMQAVLDGGKLDPEVFNSVIRYSPSVSGTGLAAVTDKKVKGVLASFITSRPGMPTLEIVDSKKGA